LGLLAQQELTLVTAVAVVVTVEQPLLVLAARATLVQVAGAAELLLTALPPVRAAQAVTVTAA
jgi:hypothetical protein